MNSVENRAAITAVIPAFKARERIQSTIQSFLDQPDIDGSVIVVIDDGCQQTADIAQSFGKAVTTIVNERNLGAAASRNRGLSQVTTQFTYFLDSDDKVEGPLLASMQKAITLDAADICFGPYVVEIESSGIRFPGHIVSRSRDKLFTDWLAGVAYVPPVSVLWRTEAVRSIGSWDETISRNDDAELVLRALIKGLRFTFGDQGLGIYVSHPSEHRVSKQSANIRDQLTIVNRLSELQGSALADGTFERAAGVGCYEIARVAFEAHQSQLGNEALTASRQYGFVGHRGGLVSRNLSKLLGLERRMKLAGALKKLPGLRPQSAFSRATSPTP